MQIKKQMQKTPQQEGVLSSKRKPHIIKLLEKITLFVATAKQKMIQFSQTLN